MGRVVNPLIVAVVAVVVYAIFTNRLAQLQLICLTFSNNVQDASKAGRLQTGFPDLLRRFGRDLVRGSTESKGDMVDNPKAKRAYLSEFFTKIQKVDDDSTSSDGNIIPGTAWRTDRSPFSEALDRITGHANLGSGSGHANSTITRRRWKTCFYCRYYELATRYHFLDGRRENRPEIPLRDATVAAFLAECQQVALLRDNTEDDSE
jgi:hypothetical protein